MKTWLWPNRTISKTESAQLREEHNATVNATADLAAACRDLCTLIDVEDHDVATVTIRVRDLVPLVRAARAAIGKATK